MRTKQLSDFCLNIRWNFIRALRQTSMVRIATVFIFKRSPRIRGDFNLDSDDANCYLIFSKLCAFHVFSKYSQHIREKRKRKLVPT